jgi:hypothetical protein
LLEALIARGKMRLEDAAFVLPYHSVKVGTPLFGSEMLVRQPQSLFHAL